MRYEYLSLTSLTNNNSTMPQLRWPNSKKWPWYEFLCEKQFVSPPGNSCPRCSTGALLPCMRLHIANGSVGPLPMAVPHRSTITQQKRLHERTHVLHESRRLRKAWRMHTCQSTPLSAVESNAHVSDRIALLCGRNGTPAHRAGHAAQETREQVMSCICRVGSTTVLQS